MKFYTKFSLILLFIFALNLQTSEACSRITYTTTSGEVVVGRNMDWFADESAIIFVNKRGEAKKSLSKSNPISWTSKYGSIGVYSDSPKGFFPNSMLNEKGLAADILYLAETDYGKVKPGVQTIGIAEQLQYFVDNFQTVNEVIDYLKNKKIQIEPTNNDFFDDYLLIIHYIITDKTGNNVIIEYIKGEVKFYQIKGRAVLTNSPEYDKMQAIYNYYKEIGGNNIPGSSLSQSRFIYLSTLLNNFTNKKLPNYIDGIKNKNMNSQAIMSVFSLMRSVSTPLGTPYSEDNLSPNNETTIWRTISDLKNLKFYFDSALTTSTFWFDLKQIDFNKNQKYEILPGEFVNGDITKNLVEKK